MSAAVTVDCVQCCCPGEELQGKACKDLEASAQSCSQAQQLLCKTLNDKLSVGHNAAEGETHATSRMTLVLHSCGLIDSCVRVCFAEFGQSHLDEINKLEALIAKEVSEKYEANPHQGE